MRALSTLLTERRREFLSDISKVSKYVKVYRVHRGFYIDPDDRDIAWEIYANSEEFSQELKKCRRIARDVTCGMTACDRVTPDNADLRARFDGNPFASEYYPIIEFGDSRVTYKPCDAPSRYPSDDGMFAYIRLGNRLANTGEDILPSAWIKAHANDMDKSEY